jgi:hypothetical protein
VAEFLTADQLPDAGGVGWKREYIDLVNVEHPLPETCGNALGPEVTQGVWDARYPAADGQEAAVEDVYTYSSASDAAARVAAATPKCDGVTAHTADGFAWHGSEPQGPSHVLFARVGNKVATLVITVGRHDYDSSLDAKILAAMTQRLQGS